MHRQSIEFVFAALVAAILSVIPNIIGKDIGFSWYLIGILTVAFLLAFVSIPRIVWFFLSKNTIKILESGVYLEFHNQSGAPNLAFFAMWPDFWSSSIYVRGAVYRISSNSHFSLKDFGRWSAKSVEIRNIGHGGQAASYFYSGWAKDAKTGDVSDVTTGMTFLNITNAGVGSGFFIDQWRAARLFSRRQDCLHLEVSKRARKILKREYGFDVFLLKSELVDRFSELGQVINKILSKENEFERVFGYQAKEFLDGCLSQKVNHSKNKYSEDFSEISDQLRSKANNSYAIYSDFHVSACVIDEKAEKHFGCNLENASYPAGICAESSAIASMISRVGFRKISSVFVYSSDNTGNLTPCGICLQRIAEFADEDTEIIILSDVGVTERGKLNSFLKMPFRLNPKTGA